MNILATISKLTVNHNIRVQLPGSTNQNDRWHRSPTSNSSHQHGRPEPLVRCVGPHANVAHLGNILKERHPPKFGERRLKFWAKTTTKKKQLTLFGSNQNSLTMGVQLKYCGIELKEPLKQTESRTDRCPHSNSLEMCCPLMQHHQQWPSSASCTAANWTKRIIAEESPTNELGNDAKLQTVRWKRGIFREKGGFAFQRKILEWKYRIQSNLFRPSGARFWSMH